MAATSRDPVEALAGRYGVVTRPRLIRTEGWSPPGFSAYVAGTGNPSVARRRYDPDAYRTVGTGRAYRDPDRARLIAVCEAVERYASMVFDEDGFVVAAADELGADALDLDEIPRCADRELRHPRCPVRPADKGARIRWVRGVELTRGRDAHVPAVMAHLGIPAMAGEHFWTQISTGCATHRSMEEALVNGICEVIERDAVALTWLLRLPLPEVARDCFPADVLSIVDWYDEREIDLRFFDATTELGIPTIYCVQTARFATKASQIVSSATELDVDAAMLKAALESIGMRAAIEGYRGAGPRRYADHTDVLDGAVLMASPARRAAFSFLLDRPDVPESRPAPVPPGTPAEQLRLLLGRLRQRDMRVYAVDLTPRELADLGQFVVQVLIPALQPMSLRPLAQYRAHGRLGTAAVAMGRAPVPPSRQNPWPQPMA